MNILDKIKVDKLTKSEREVITFLYLNPDVAEKSIYDIAECSHTSLATVSRAIKKIGFTSLNELRYEFNRQTRNDEKVISDIQTIIHKSEVEVINTINQLDMNQVAKISEVLLNCDCVCVVSRGLSQNIADEFTLKLNLLGKQAYNFVDPNIIMNFGTKINSKTILVAFSLNGETEEILILLQKVKLLNVKVIVFTCNPQSKMLEYSDHNLVGYRHKHVSLIEFEVASRLGLSVLSRVVLDYLILRITSK